MKNPKPFYKKPLFWSFIVLALLGIPATIKIFEQYLYPHQIEPVLENLYVKEEGSLTELLTEPAPEDFYIREDDISWNSHSKAAIRYTNNDVDSTAATPDLVTNIIKDYYKRANTDTNTEKPYTYSENSYASGAILRKDKSKYKSGILISEAQKIASVTIDSFDYKVTEASIFHYEASLRRGFEKEDEIYSRLQPLRIIGILKLSSGIVKSIPIEINDDGRDISFFADVDTDTLERGENFLCLYTESDAYDLSDGSCIKLIRIGGPIQENIHYEHAPKHYISADGYYVLIDGEKIFYDDDNFTPLLIYDYRYSENKDYIILDARHYEGGTAPVYRLASKKKIDMDIDYDSIWKETNEGYRVYVCSSGGYSQYLVKYYNINSSDGSISEQIISEGNFLSCDYKDDKIRIIERDSTDKNRIKYFEYSMDSDMIVNEMFFEGDPEFYFGTSESIDQLVSS